ncbi:ribonuclease H2, subunit C [Mycena latifolia]|nr:ribonuclease H2, subunit C [Mycena latifolia]
MAARTLNITPISSLLPSASPNLMPFHVDHNGPAPISTYFLVEAASEDVVKPPPPTTEQDLEMIDSEEPVSTTAEPEAASPDAPPLSDSALSRRVTEATTRFIATFRGRSMHGLKVELPSGYSGILMQGEGATGTGKLSALKAKVKRAVKAPAKPRGNKAGRATRSAMRDENDEEEIEAEDQTNARTLMPTAQFSSFVVWHPDIPVNPGRDEYLRSLTEWTQLADEIHRFEE